MLRYLCSASSATEIPPSQRQVLVIRRVEPIAVVLSLSVKYSLLAFPEAINLLLLLVGYFWALSHISPQQQMKL